MANEFTSDERRFLLEIARKTVKSGLDNVKQPAIENPDEKFEEKRGVFVTIHKGGSLRGCIGYPLPVKSIIESVIDNAFSSAFEDPRFPPLENDEFDEIDIEISILTVPKRISNIGEVKVGRDGIIVSKNMRRGLLLPQVPVEQKWNLEEYLSYGCLKAGLTSDEWKKGVDIEIFQAEVFGEHDFEN